MTRQLHYIWRVARSVFATGGQRRRLPASAVLPGLVVMMIVAGAAWGSPATAMGGITADETSEIDRLLDRTRLVDASLASVEAVYREAVAPLETVLLHYKNDPRLVRRIATALVTESRRSNVSPDILLAVLLVENPWLDPDARSPVGALGLMQVMPLHRGHWKACPQDLNSIEGNICYGAQIFRDYVRVSDGNMEKALLRYNGCVNGTNTPNCGNYPNTVFARAGRAAFLSKSARTTP